MFFMILFYGKHKTLVIENGYKRENSVFTFSYGF